MEDRARKYIENLEVALNALKRESLGSAARVVDLAASYMRDAAYYLEAGDPVTSIACSSYAEGLIDALGLLGLAQVTWPKRRRPKVLVGGVFEIVHPGHLYLLRRAKELGRVIVIVARDSTVAKLKGRPPVVPEEQRLEVVRSIRYVDEAYLGSEPLDIEGTLRRHKPDIVLLGPDQSVIEELVRRAIKKLGVKVKVVKLKERVGSGLTSSSEIIRRILASAF
ncbi:MAG: DUF357 domain-containing protein [Thermoprotei archaeon]|nr:MAG: DUF357 domain-containing protein [Thermoprotei archaeon]HDD34269.1 cytidylyltransferase family protein [Thermofilaceae archaeon]